MKFISPLITVRDMRAAREFYESVLGQELLHDFGANIAFKSGLSLHDRTHYAGLIGRDETSITSKPCDMELYFEEDDLEKVERALDARNVEYLHRIIEQAWRQRAIRFFDPDGHIVEVGESMEAAVRRLHAGGMSAEEIARESLMPMEFIAYALGTSTNA
ncbi:MAG TPA: VOC family protein [Spirochaetota bacterium]|nr:VOC family protein [Spirochaetota bacterium]